MTEAVQTRLNNLVVKIRPIDEYVAHRLEDLNDALDDPTQARGWAGIDLFRVIDPDSLAERYNTISGRVAGMLEVFRNVSIFLPILITWLGIAAASNAYDQLLNRCLKSCPDQVSQPFLYLWEQGFGGNFPDLLKLSSIGIIDAVILLFVVLSTLFLSASSMSRSQQLHADLINALADASLLLQSLPPVKPTSGTPSGIPSGTTVQGLDAIVQKFSDMSTDILAQFGELKLSLSAATDQIKIQFDATQKAVGDINTLIGELQATCTSFEEAGDRVSTQLSLVVIPLENVATQQTSLLDRVNEAANHLEKSAGHLGAIENSYEDLMEWHRNTLAQQDDVAGKLDDASANLRHFDDKLGQFLASLQEESEAQRLQADRIAEVGESFRQTIVETSAEATNIRNLAWEMNDAVKLLTRLANASGVDLFAFIDSYTQAAGEISSSANLLGKSAQTLDNSANALNRMSAVIYKATQDLQEATAQFKTAASQPS